ncbi:MAG TPA: TonB family protein [Bacteroidales bacterium]|nr:TonB family protein [Bacteroidales bacterium]HPS72974.1 TonB family protein [Bacteroidales bacterium]
MAMEKEYPETLEDLVFEKRNKDYGSYFLRKKYRKYVTISMIIGLLILAGVVAYPLISAYINKTRLIREKEKTVSVEMMKVMKEELPPPPPPPPPPDAIVEKVKFTAPVVVEDTNIETGLMTQDDLSAKGNTEVPTEDVEIEIKDEKPQVIEQKVEAEIFTVVEEQPGYPGGEEGRMKYLKENIRYPEEAKELGIQGRVFVTFVVEVDGSITDVRVLRGIGGGCDEEAVRVVRGMPKWVPGKQRGVPVRVQFNLPIRFTLQ